MRVDKCTVRASMLLHLQDTSVYSTMAVHAVVMCCVTTAVSGLSYSLPDPPGPCIIHPLNPSHFLRLCSNALGATLGLKHIAGVGQGHHLVLKENENSMPLGDHNGSL